MTTETQRPLRVLLLAPHPFYQERGTPIAVDMMLRALSARGARVDVLTFPEGEDRSYPGVALHRVRGGRGLREIPPGFSLKKLRGDARLLAETFRRVRREKPDVIHAVEESVFIALLMKWLFRVPYVYDMDSSMARQLVEKMAWLRPAGPLFRWAEAVAARSALMVIPVCEALAEIARRARAREVRLLTDVSLVRREAAPDPARRDAWRAELGARDVCFMYIGNLESYQGIDLLLESFRRALREEEKMSLVLVGGAPAAVEAYRQRVAAWQLTDRVRVAGPRPVAAMAALFEAADVLVSPRTQGENTPMKLYSYLDSGRPVLATDLPTHTQVVTRETAELTAPAPDAMAAAMVRLAREPARRERLAAAASALAQARYSPEAFSRNASAIYDALERALGHTPAG